MFRRLTILLWTFRWPVLLGMMLVTLVTGLAIFRLQIDPSMETLFDKRASEYKYYQDYRDRYGSDQMIAIAMSTTDLFTVRNLKKLWGITEHLEAYPQVERVLSLANAKDIRHKFFGVKLVPPLGDAYEGGSKMLEAKQLILHNELYLNNLISRDGKIANILVYLKPHIGRDKESNGRFIRDLRAYLKEVERPGVQFYVAGSPVEQFDFIRLIRRDQMLFVPMIAILLIVTTTLMYGSLTCMLLSMSIVFMTLIWSLGTIALLGQDLNLMTSLLGPVIMIVSVINSVYLINLFFEIRQHHTSLREAIALTVEQLGVPCFLTHFTAMIGFASLGLNPVPAIQSFGIFAAVGTFYSYVIEIVLTVVLVSILPYRPRKVEVEERKHWFNHVLVGFLEKLDFKWKWWIIALTIAGTALSLVGIRRVEVDTNIISQMKPDLPLAVATRFIDNRLTGVYSLGFVIRLKDGGTFVDPAMLRRVDELKNYLESKPEISKVNSITTVIKKIHEAVEDEASAYVIPQDSERLRRYFEELAKSEDPELRKLISPDFKEICLEARMKAVGTTRGAAMEASVRAFLAENFEKYFTYQITGNVVLLGKMAKNLVSEQLQSFGFAFVAILVIVMIFFRSVRMGLLAAIPNLFPILAIYGLMGFIRIELSTPTAMIASIVLGLVVDAPIQFLYRFRYEFSHRHHYLQALHHTYRNIGQSLVMSTFILMAGFAASAFANFRPTIHFGLLTSVTIFLALLCTILVLPVTILMTKPFGRQRLFKKRWE